MPYIALKRLRWGNGYIEPGEAVPEGEAGRSYANMVRLGEISAVASGAPASSGGDAKTKAQLYAQAESMGVKIDKRWGIDTIVEKLEEAHNAKMAERAAAELAALRNEATGMGLQVDPDANADALTAQITAAKDEAEKAAAELEALQKSATELGIEIDPSWDTETLNAKIAEAKATAEAKAKTEAEAKVKAAANSGNAGSQGAAS